MNWTTKTALLGGAVFTLAGWGGAAAHAQQFALVQSDEVTVTATRNEERVDNVPATVSVITDEEIEENLAGDIKDLVRFEPGVSVRRQPARFSAAGSSTGRDGSSGFNIRGLDGNRVLIQVDGVRLPDAYSFGPALSFGRGDFVDLDLMRSVEILRGPSSALYGSDGLAGAVSFTLREPGDLLDSGDVFGGRARVTYSSADESWAESLIGAARAGDWSAMLAYTRRDGHEMDNQGDDNSLNAARTAPNPIDSESNSALGRIVFEPSSSNRFRLTAEYDDSDLTGDVISSRSIPPYTTFGQTESILAHDTSERSRVTLDHRYDSPGGAIDSIFWAIYHQDSEGTQFTAEDRAISADRTRFNTFETSVWGATAQFDSSFALGASQHVLTYGGDYSETRQEGVRDGTIPPTGETYPTRAFPNTDYTLAGVYVQDAISFLDGAVTFYPALRYDQYELSPEADALYPAAVAGQDDSHLSPKFGIVAWPTETLGAFFNYAEGFKAPAPSQVNNFFENLIFGYTSLPNPDLGPETSQALEAGIRMRDAAFAGGVWNSSVTAFHSDYEDFISQEVVGGTGAPGNPLQYQYVNLSSVSISGVEARAHASWSNGFGFNIAAAAIEGDQRTAGVVAPLNSVDPWSVVAGISYDAPSGRFGGQAIVTHSSGKDDGDVDQSACTVNCFTPSDFTILDLTAYWNITDQATLRVGVFNVTDEHYWWWSDVRGLNDSAIDLDAYTQPGRNVSASISYRF